MVNMESRSKMDHSLSLLCSLDEMRNHGDLCDFEIRVAGKMFRVHRSVLAACSKYFKGMLTSDMMESRQGYVDFRNLSVEGIESCIEFMYVGEIQLVPTSLHLVIEASHLFELSQLTNICLEYLRSNLNGETCLYSLNIFKIYGNDDDVTAAEDQLIQNMDLIVRADMFCHIPECDIIRYLKNPNLTPEIHWKATIVWMEENNPRQNFLSIAVSSLLMKKEMSLRFLVLTVWSHARVQSNALVKSLVVEELSCHAETLEKDFELDVCFELLKIINEQEFLHRDLVKQSIVKYLAENFEDAVKNDGFVRITRQVLMRILHSPSNVCLLHLTKWEAVIKWVREKESRADHLPKLMKEVDIGKLPSDYIDRNIRRDPLVKNSAECLDVLYKVMFERQSSKENATASTSSTSSVLVMMDFGCGSLIALDLQGGRHSTISKFPIIRPKITSVNRCLYLLHDKDVYKFTKTKTWQRQLSSSRNLGASKILVTFRNEIYLVGEDETVCYNPNQNKWMMGLPGCGFIFGFAAAASGDFIYAFEPNDGRNAKRYEPGLASWTPIASMGESRCGASAAAYRGNIYLAGGFNVVDSRLHYLNSVERYDPSMDSWEFLAGMINRRGGFSLVTFEDNLYAVGGACDNEGRRLEDDSIEMYDAQSNQWIVVTNMKKSQSFISSCVYDVR